MEQEKEEQKQKKPLSLVRVDGRVRLMVNHSSQHQPLLLLLLQDGYAQPMAGRRRHEWVDLDRPLPFFSIVIDSQCLMDLTQPRG